MGRRAFPPLDPSRCRKCKNAPAAESGPPVALVHQPPFGHGKTAQVPRPACSRWALTISYKVCGCAISTPTLPPIRFSSSRSSPETPPSRPTAGQGRTSSLNNLGKKTLADVKGSRSRGTFHCFHTVPSQRTASHPYPPSGVQHLFQPSRHSSHAFLFIRHPLAPHVTYYYHYLGLKGPQKKPPKPSHRSSFIVPRYDELFFLFFY
ncbi:hypothetical protein QBC38DRAFT_231702 [Podospora fimiseda]|uniref:Uncharacterized protein n=1 Tax=Podospora fimiseda TaxID=252190 RepID=A0AAN7GXF5_9PEZI|nr:hypothetical protein QBC38DRAFT_231702 [Podospora fimiseda]